MLKGAGRENRGKFGAVPSDVQPCAEFGSPAPIEKIDCPRVWNLPMAHEFFGPSS